MIANELSIRAKFAVFPKYLLACILLLWIVDLFTLYSVAGGDFSLWAAKQLVSMFVGGVIVMVLGVIDIRHIFRFSYVLYLFAIFMLLMADLMGYTAMGAQRWLRIGPLSIQPSEIAKPLLLLVLARYYHSIHTNSLPNLKTHLPPLIVIALPVWLILRQPNLGTAAILAMVGGMIMLLAGVQLKKFFIAGGIGLLGMPLLWNLLHPYQKKRVLTFLNPESDPLGAGYNIIQSKVAIGSGGMFGKGFMQGTQSQLSFLPEKQTDFIFTVIAEEYGLIGASLVLLIFVIMVAYCMKMASFSRQQFTRLIISGFAFMLTLHVFINIGMISGMIPAVGIPLPFLSYGGSNLVAMCSCIGLVVNCIVYDKVNCQ